MSMPSESSGRRRWIKRIATITAVLLVLGGIWFGWHEWRIAETHGRYLAMRDSLHAQGEPVLPADLAALYRTDDANNAVIPLRQAAALVPQPTEDQPQEDKDDLLNAPLVIPLTPRERQLLVPEQKTQPQITSLVREASHLPDAWWNLQINGPLLTFLCPDLIAQRGVCNVLDHAALLAADRGDYADAFENAALILTPARAMRHYPTLVAYLVSSGLEASALGRMEDVCARATIGEGSPQSIKPAAIRQVMQVLMDEREENSAIRIAYLADRVQMTEAMELVAVGQMPLEGDNGPTVKLNLYLARPQFWKTGTVVTEQLSRVARATAAPDWPTARSSIPTPFKPTGSSIADKLFEILTPSYSRPAYHHYRTVAMRRLARAALALHLYRSEHGGEFPATLDQLVPQYLPAVPRDPFVTGASSIRYIRDAGNARVYSVGSNGVDDNGVDGVDVPRPRGDNSSVASDRGDIVFRLTPKPRPPSATESAATPTTLPADLLPQTQPLPRD
jgi:hypothetical protein